MQHTGHVLLNCVCYWEGFWSAVGYLLVLRFLAVKCYTQIFNCVGVRAPNPTLFKGQLYCQEYGLFPKSDCYHEEFGLYAIPFPLDLYLLLLETLKEVNSQEQGFSPFCLAFCGPFMLFCTESFNSGTLYTANHVGSHCEVETQSPHLPGSPW